MLKPTRSWVCMTQGLVLPLQHEAGCLVFYSSADLMRVLCLSAHVPPPPTSSCCLSISVYFIKHQFIIYYPHFKLYTSV